MFALKSFGSIPGSLVKFIRTITPAFVLTAIAFSSTMAPTICVQQLSKDKDSCVDEKKERALLAHSFITPGCIRQKLQSYVDGTADVTNCFG
jgi:hypothetical protein